MLGRLLPSRGAAACGSVLEMAVFRGPQLATTASLEDGACFQAVSTPGEEPPSLEACSHRRQAAAVGSAKRVLFGKSRPMCPFQRRCVLEQMVTWHGRQQRRLAWWPQPWCVLGVRAGGGSYRSAASPASGRSAASASGASGGRKSGTKLLREAALPKLFQTRSGSRQSFQKLGECADGSPCRPVGGSASWLDGADKCSCALKAPSL